jgi:hypothetical protein
VGAALASGVAVDRRGLAVRDHVDAVQREPVLLVEIPAHGLGAFETELFVVLLVDDFVVVEFDMEL